MVFLLVRANEANMFEKNDCDVLEKIDHHKISKHSGDMVGVEEHVTDIGFWSGWESEDGSKTVGTAGLITRGKKSKNNCLVKIQRSTIHSLYDTQGKR